MRRAVLLVLIAAACAGPPTSGSTSPTTMAPTTPPPSTVSTTVPASTTTGASLPGEALVSIPVGVDGIVFRQGAEDLETLGPSLLAVDPVGGIHIVDPVGLEILSFMEGGRRVIALPSMDILNVTAIAATTDQLLVVEVFFAPERQRVHRIGLDGELIESIALEPGVRLEDGLSGVLAGPSGQIILEFEGGARYATWSGETFEVTRGLTIGTTTILSDGPDLIIDGRRIDAELTSGMGGLRYLGSATDGTRVIERVDVVSLDPAIRVLATVEWYSPDGELLGSARIPSIEDQAIDQPPGVAITADGRALALVAHVDAVEVIELPRVPGRITSLGE